MAIKDFKTHTECLSTDGFPVREEGWFLKHIDTGLQYFMWHGGWHPDGLGLSLAPLVKSGHITTNPGGVASVVFGTHYVDAEYGIAMTCQNKGAQEPHAVWTAKSATGFSLRTVNASGAVLGSVFVDWVCSRYYDS